MTPPSGPEQAALQSAASSGAGSILLRGVDRERALEVLRTAAPGFPAERYEEALDEALRSRRWFRDEGERERETVIAAALDSDILDAVFQLRHFNTKNGNRDSWVGLGPIDIERALRPRFSRAEIHRALPRVDALIRSAPAIDFLGPEAPDMQAMRLMHPGFSDDSIRALILWGMFLWR